MRVNIQNKYVIVILTVVLLSMNGFVSYGDDNGNTISVHECEGLFASGFNPKDNLVSSTLGLCLPGVILNLEKLEEIECEKIICEYDAAQNGYSPILCAKQSAYESCLVEGQGAFIGLAEDLLIGSFRDNIKRVLENPLALAIDLGKKELLRQASCNQDGTVCTPAQKTANIGLGIIEVANVYSTLKSLGDQFEGYDERTYCERLEEEYKPKLEEIVNEYYASVQN